ncbi:hypothetical protein BX661DRAFT_31179 [Kickxella alabastrina]|uniref:uncharacterized protein n=1 Tax=Kickxella alabastrina TaxID=61397 RepID=UPI00222030FE|nr:uncharacterized protein BX661DRAFT_31179 [Kickxella alabastrina]KAI7826853.1 hypothetical protein BX661DRAFT_31179 [Kickxella alabastrina]
MTVKRAHTVNEYIFADPVIEVTKCAPYAFAATGVLKSNTTASMVASEWSTISNMLFYRAIAKLTRFQDNNPYNEYQSLESSDIDAMVSEHNVSSKHNYAYTAFVSAATTTTPNNNSNRISNFPAHKHKALASLRFLQTACGNVFTLHQINSKVAYAKRFITNAFISLYATGYFADNQEEPLPISNDPNAGSQTNKIKGMNCTNVNPENQQATESLIRYMLDKSSLTAPFIKPKDISILRTYSEIDMWMRAMIEFHSAKMTAFLDSCAHNLANRCIIETRLNLSKLESPICKAKPIDRKHTVEALNKLLDGIKYMSNSIKNSTLDSVNSLGSASSYELTNGINDMPDSAIMQPHKRRRQQLPSPLLPNTLTEALACNPAPPCAYSLFSADLMSVFYIVPVSKAAKLDAMRLLLGLGRA